MTVINPNSVAGINSITVQSGEALSVHKSDGTLIQTIVSSTGISTFSSVSVGSATTTNNADKSINIGLGASISQHAVNSLSFGTGGDEKARLDANGFLGIGTATVGAPLQVYNATNNTIARLDSGDATCRLQLVDSAGTGFVAVSGDDLFFANTSSITERLRITSTGDINVSTAATIKANGNATFSGIVTATSFVGDGSGLTGAGPTLANGSDNRVVTATGANAINGEASLVYTGSRFGVNISGGTITDIPATAHDTMVVGNSSMTSGGICLEGSSSSGNLGFQMFKGGSFLAARMLYEFTNNELQFHSATGASPGAGEATRLRLKPDGDVQIEDGDLIIGGSGHGIDFAIQTATSVSGTSVSSELLDHYEEGTFTPEYNSGSAGSACFASGITYSSQVGHYTKVGNLVTFQLKLDPNSSGLTAKSGTLQINNLPFNCKNVQTNGGAFFVLTSAFGATDTLPNPVMITGSNGIQFYKNNAGGFAGTDLPVPSNYIQLAGVYLTD